MSSGIALKSFSLANDVLQLSPDDEIFRFDKDAQQQVLNAEPWAADPHHFKTCCISAIALIKMVIHARSGVPYEVMGMMQGKVVGNSMVIMDSFPLPVQGTETRVNAADSANEFMVQYVTSSDRAKRFENPIGWYHSHPGYGCWLSGIDVTTQMNNQQFQDPFVAVVIDPNRTISAGKVDIGAFRTYPANYTPPSASTSEYQSIPLSKIEDFGVHANQYYQLDVQIFTSTLDKELLGALWNKYWVSTLGQSPLISNRAYAASQLGDLHEKLVKARSSVGGTRATVPSLAVKEEPGKDKEVKDKTSLKSENEEKKKDDNQLARTVKDSTKIAAEAQHGLIAQVIKDVIFSLRPGASEASTAAQKVDDAVEMTVG